MSQYIQPAPELKFKDSIVQSWNGHRQYQCTYLSDKHGTAGNLSSCFVDAQTAWSLGDIMHISPYTHHHMKPYRQIIQMHQNAIIYKVLSQILDNCTRTHFNRRTELEYIFRCCSERGNKEQKRSAGQREGDSEFQSNSKRKYWNQLKDYQELRNHKKCQS